MKKSYLLMILAVGAAAVACQEKEPLQSGEENAVQETGLVEVAVPCSVAQTKTRLEAGGKVVWNQGNAIAVIPADALEAGTTYTLTAQDKGESVLFKGEVPDGTTRVFAAYPDKAQTFTAESVRINLSSAQKGVKDTFNDDLQVMVASGDIADGLTFSNACGLIRFTIAGEDVSAVEFRTASSKHLLAGNALVKFNLDAPAVADETTRRWAIQFTPKSGTYFEPGTYYLTAWPGDIEGFTLTYVTAAGDKVRTTGKTLKVKRSQIVTLPGSDADVDLTSVSFNLSGSESRPLDKVEGQKVYEGTFEVPAAGTFTISIDGEEYGFMAFSGNGGVGIVHNDYAAVPYWAIKNVPEITKEYDVIKAVGRMEKVSESNGHDFWLNMGAAASLYVRVDLSASTPRYYIEKVVADSDLVFYEGFDLCVWGGDYMAGNIRGYAETTFANIKDGTEVLTNLAAAMSNWGYGPFNYPALGNANTDAPDAYIKNRGLEGWTLQRCGERPKGIGVCDSNATGKLQTPAFSRLTSATDLTLEIDMARFSATAPNPIKIKIVGSGTFTSGQVQVDEQELRTGLTFADDNKTFVISGTDKDLCPPSATKEEYGDTYSVNATPNKPVSHFTFQIAGASDDTCILFDTTENKASGGNRFFVFKVEARKNG